MEHQATSSARANARTLRRGMTDSERCLWSRLRGGQLGVRFRRQHPLGPYIADFACLAPKLIVELDGSQHARQQAYDRRRDIFFKGQGFDVLRFGTDEPFIHLEGVLQAILNRLDDLMTPARIPGPHPNLPPEGEGARVPPPLGEGRVGASNAQTCMLESTAAGPHPCLPPEGEGA